ncbi:MAG: AAA family ATPase [Coleofasciculus sp. A1-SPW-01]|uniref:AAA family ATPase n=1 Tax=Coleofasciculus sp. A1-SPW-01 TaxID=3070819 RepID=UPI003301C3EC
MSQSTSPESNNKEVQGITRISVQGFKSLYDECSIEIRPLTILAGANSSGKSSIMQPLLLMKQTLEATYDPGALLLNGSNVQFTSNEQILSKIYNYKQSDEFSVKVEIKNHPFIKVLFNTDATMGFAIEAMTIKSKDSEHEIYPDMPSHDIVSILPNLLWGIYKTMAKFAVMPLNFCVIRNRCFLHFEATDRLTEQSSMPFNLAAFLEPHIRQLIHIPGLRGNPERTYAHTAVGLEFPGTFEKYVASVVNYWQKTQDKRIRDLENALEFLGLTSRVEAKQFNDTQLELRIGRLSGSFQANDMVSIADVGIGVSQVLPVLVALLVAEPGQLVYIEQPELHLHPRAQAALANILANAAKRGVRVVIETHSELLLLAVQSLVAERKLSPDLVKLHWFTRGDDGMTKVSSADLDEAGAFGDFPEDFSDVSLKLESRYLNAAESRLSEGSSGS